MCLVRRRDWARPGWCCCEIFPEEVGLGLGYRILQSHSPWEPQFVGMGCPVPICSGICCTWGSVKRKSPSLHGGIISPRRPCLWLSSLQWTPVCYSAWQVPDLLGGHLDRREEAGARGQGEGCSLCLGAGGCGALPSQPVWVTLLGEGLLWLSPRAPEVPSRVQFSPALDW